MYLSTQKMLCFFLAVCSLTLKAQWENFTNSGAIYSLAKQGKYLWVGSQGGITRINLIDSSQFYFTRANSALTDNSVKKLVADETNLLWVVCADNRLVFYDGSAWSVYDSTNSPIKGFVHDIAYRKGKGLYVQDANNIHIYKNKTWSSICSVHLPGPYSPMSLSIDTAGNAITGTDSALVFSNASGCSTVFATGFTGYSYVASTHVDHDNNVWCAPWSNELWKYDGTNWTFYDLSGYGSYGIPKIYTDSHDSIWFLSTWLYKFNGTDWQNKTPSGWYLNDARSMFVDSLDNVTLGLGTGLYKKAEDDMIRVSCANSPLGEERIFGVFADSKNRKWIATNTVHRYDDSSWVDYSQQISSDTYTEVNEDPAGNIWASTLNSGIKKFNGSTWTTYTTSNAGEEVKCFSALETDGMGHVWLGSCDGSVYRFHVNIWTRYTNTSGGIMDIAALNSNERWFATIGGGIFKMTGNNFTATVTTKNSSLPSDTVYCLKQDQQGRMWAGTSQGLAMFDGKTWQVIHSDNYCLSSEDVLSIAEDSHGILWLLTLEGLTKFNPGECYSYVVENSGILNGRYFSLYIDKNDWKWIGGERGVSVFKGDGPEMTVRLVEQNQGPTKIYPSPARDIIFIETQQEINKGKFSLYDLEGALITQLDYKSESTGLSVRGAKPGIYIYVLKDADGIVARGKIVIE
jgi:ligand-binding sensor domain-containing protein